MSRFGRLDVFEHDSPLSSPGFNFCVIIHCKCIQNSFCNMLLAYIAIKLKCNSLPVIACERIKITHVWVFVVYNFQL